MRNMLWKFWLLTAAALTLVYFVVPKSPESKLVLYNGLGLLAVLALLVGMHINKTRPKAPWFWLVGGLTSFLVADVIYYLLELKHGADDVPFPNPADIFYLLMYPMVMIGLTLMVRAVSPGRDKASFIDAAVVGIAMFGALWVLFVDSSFSDDTSFLTLVVTLAYPVMDVFLLAVAARLIVTVHLKHFPFAFMVGAIASLAIADVAYNIALGNGTFKTGTWIDAFWLGFYTLMAASARVRRR